MDDASVPTIPLSPFVVSIPFGDEVIEPTCIVTHHGDIVISAGELTSSFTGCNIRSASIKISMLYKTHPQLRPAPRGLQQYSKVCSYLYCVSLFELMTGCCSLSRSLWNSCHTLKKTEHSFRLKVSSYSSQIQSLANSTRNHMQAKTNESSKK